MKRRRRKNPVPLLVALAPIMPYLGVSLGLAATGLFLKGAEIRKAEEDYEAYKQTLTDPNPPPAPAAPKASELTTWTPEDRQAADVVAWNDWKTWALDTPAPLPEKENPWPYLAAVAGIVAAWHLWTSR